MHNRKILFSVALATATLLVLLSFSSAESQQFTLASPNMTGGASCGLGSHYPVISDSGRYVAFSSGCNNLTTGVTGTTLNAYLRDLTTNTTTLVSADITNTTGGNAESYVCDISTDGRYVLFISSASNLTPDGAIEPRLFVRDLQKQITTPVNLRANCGGTYASISADGTTVVAEVGKQSAQCDGNTDVYAWNRITGAVTLVSANPRTGLPARGASTGSVVSADGRYVYFQSDADDLVPNDRNGQTDIFVRDMQTGVISLVSNNVNGTGSGDGASFMRPKSGYWKNHSNITPDGRFVVFASSATDLVAGQRNGGGEMFVRDLWTNTTSMISNRGRSGPGRAHNVGDGQISPDGRFVVYELRAVDSNGPRSSFVYRYDRDTDTSQLVSLPPVNMYVGDDYLAVGISPDGRYVAFRLAPRFDSHGGEAFVRDMQTGTIVSISSAKADSTVNGVSIAPSSGTIAIDSYYALLPQDDNQYFDVYTYQPGPLSSQDGMIERPAGGKTSNW